MDKEKGKYKRMASQSFSKTSESNSDDVMKVTHVTGSRAVYVWVVVAGLLSVLVSLCTSGTILYFYGNWSPGSPDDSAQPTDSQALYDVIKEEVQRLLNEYPFEHKSVELTPIGLNTTALPSSPLHAAHVYLKDVPGSSVVNDSRFSPLLGWSEDGDSAFIRRGITYDAAKGMFHITRGGLYHVYSHLSFSVGVNATRHHHHHADQASQNHHKHRTLYQMYWQRIRRDGSEDDLLQDQQMKSCPLDWTSVPCHTSTLFSAVRLRNDDRIYVSASPSEQLHRQERACVFGLYRLDND